MIADVYVYIYIYAHMIHMITYVYHCKFIVYLCPQWCTGGWLVFATKHLQASTKCGVPSLFQSSVIPHHVAVHDLRNTDSHAVASLCHMRNEHGATWVMKAQRMSFQLFTNFTLPRDIGSDPFGGPARWRRTGSAPAIDGSMDHPSRSSPKSPDPWLPWLLPHRVQVVVDGWRLLQHLPHLRGNIGVRPELIRWLLQQPSLLSEVAKMADNEASRPQLLKT